MFHSRLLRDRRSFLLLCLLRIFRFGRGSGGRRYPATCSGGRGRFLRLGDEWQAGGLIRGDVAAGYRKSCNAK